MKWEIIRDGQREWSVISATGDVIPGAIALRRDLYNVSTVLYRATRRCAAGALWRCDGSEQLLCHWPTSTLTYVILCCYIPRFRCRRRRPRRRYCRCSRQVPPMYIDTATLSASRRRDSARHFPRARPRRRFVSPWRRDRPAVCTIWF